VNASIVSEDLEECERTVDLNVGKLIDTKSSEQAENELYCTAKYLIKQAIATESDFSFDLSSMEEQGLTYEDCKHKIKQIESSVQEHAPEDFRRLSGDCAGLASFERKLSLSLLRTLTTSYANIEQVKLAERSRYVAEVVALNKKLRACMKPAKFRDLYKWC